MIDIDDIENSTKPARIVYGYIDGIVESNQFQATGLFCEMLMWREDSLTFSNNVNFWYTDIDKVMCFSTTCHCTFAPLNNK